MKSSIRKPPYAATLLATAVVLSLLGVYGVALLQGRQLARELSTSIVVVAELRPSVTEAQRLSLGTWLEGQAFAKTGSVEFVSAEAGAEVLRDRYGEDFLSFEVDNPLFSLYSFRLAAAYVGPASQAEAKANLIARDEVLDVYVQDDVLASLASRASKFVWIGLFTGLVLLLGVCFLVVNTTRLALLSRATVIRNMELVGAAWGFISRPFLQRAAIVGTLGGALAAAATLGITAAARAQVAEIWQPLTTANYIALSIALVATGLLLNFVATFAVVRKTLKLRIDDLG